MATIREGTAVELPGAWNSQVQNPFIGAWKLVSCNAYRRNGRIRPLYGPEPLGRLFYDAAGNMSVQIMRADRPTFRSANKARATDEEMHFAYQGYEAYFSNYEVDLEHNRIDHRVLGGLFPNWIGSLQRRFFRFDGPDVLILSTEPPGSEPVGRTVVTLVWERLS